MFLILFGGSAFCISLAVRGYWSCPFCLPGGIWATCWMQGEQYWALINLVWYSRWLLQISVSAQSPSRKEVIHLHLLFLLLCLKKSKRSAYESGEEHSAKYSNSNNSGNYREKSLLLHSYDDFFCCYCNFLSKKDPGSPLVYMVMLDYQAW